MERGNRKLAFIVMIILILIPITSAGLFDWMKKTITGRASSAETNVSVTISGANQVEITSIVLSGSNNYNPLEANSRTMTAYITVYDADGVNDINDSSVQANFSRTGETTRINTTCINHSDIDANTANFTCEIKMWYWDGDGDWNVSASGNDFGNGARAHNVSGNSFSYVLLRALVLSPNALTWGSISSGASDAKATNDPSLINNTGNYNATINVTGIDLRGQTTPAEFIDVANFTAGPADDCAVSGIALQNATATEITATAANRGNLSIGSLSGQEQLFYCIPTVPPVSSQLYETNETFGGAWTVAYLSP